MATLLTREQILTFVYPLVVAPDAQPGSPTKSTSRAGWRELTEWTTFTAEVRNYWDTLEVLEKTALCRAAYTTLFDQILALEQNRRRRFRI